MPAIRQTSADVCFFSVVGRQTLVRTRGKAAPNTESLHRLLQKNARKSVSWRRGVRLDA